jgi:hypothetical protein
MRDNSISIGEPEKKTTHGRSRRRWEATLTIYLVERECVLG